MVMPQVIEVHEGDAMVLRHLAFPQGRLELREKLRPNGDHPHKKGDGRQRRRFFHKNPEHRTLPINY
jgi:hypothetical protein